MTVIQLILMLQTFPPNAKVIGTASDNEWGEWAVDLTPAMVRKDSSDNVVWIDLED